jgi:hypothetical protein
MMMMMTTTIADLQCISSNFRVRRRLIGPCVLSYAQVDFGLLSVEGRVERTLSFVNTSDIPLQWALEQVTRCAQESHHHPLQSIQQPQH